MPNKKLAKYEIHLRFVSNIVWQGTRLLTRVSGSEFENEEASCSVGEGVMIYIRGRQPMAHGAITSGTQHYSTNLSLFEWMELHINF
ncbi:hypothetical protein TNCV_2901741 [Trichonephila clavipes]|nr:hypothetical protein TNCV_2901741 [Trichonephila clavipes]